MATYRVDWPYIRDELLPVAPLPGERWELVALPVGGRQILASVIGDRLRWKATYRTGGYDYSDWDLLRAMGDAIYSGLGDSLMLTDLIAELNEIEQAIIDSACPCTTTSTTAAEVEGEVVTYESGGSFAVAGSADGLPDATNPPPVGYSDTTGIIDTDGDGIISQEEWETYLCKAASWFFDLVLDMLAYIQFAHMVAFVAVDVARWIINRLAARLVTGPAGGLVLFTIDQLQDWSIAFTEEITAANIAQARQEIASARQEIVCCMATATTATAAADCLRQGISLHVTDATVAAFLVAGPWTSVAAIIWNLVADVSGWECGCTSVEQGFYAAYTDTDQSQFDNRVPAAGGIDTYVTYDTSAEVPDCTLSYPGCVRRIRFYRVADDVQVAANVRIMSVANLFDTANYDTLTLFLGDGSTIRMTAAEVSNSLPLSVDNVLTVQAVTTEGNDPVISFMVTGSP